VQTNSVIDERGSPERTSASPTSTTSAPHWWYSLTSSGVATVMFTMFVGFYFVQHWIGVEGMPRRIANHPDLPGNVTVLNETSSIGSWVLTL
jgi:cytochrome c oxidase subunit 1